MYSLNEKLIYKVFDGMPFFLTKRQKALFIYDRLCQLLEYSMDYYLQPQATEDFYRYSDNLQLIDGETRKDVVCFTFNAIYLRLLEIEGICDKATYRYNYDDMFYDQGFLEGFHQALLLTIDRKMYHVDATYGVLDNNDLTLSKLSENPFMGWEVEESNAKKKAKIEQGLKKDIEKVRLKSNSNLRNLTIDYVLQKGDEYRTLSREDRYNLFIELLKYTPDYSIASFSYLLKLKKALFTKGEYTSAPKGSLYMGLKFVIDKKDNEYKAVFFFNPKGYEVTENNLNRQDIKFYEFSPMSKELKETTSRKVLKNLVSEKYKLRRNDALPKSIEDLKAKFKEEQGEEPEEE